MGSQSDWPTMREAAAGLDELGVPYEARIVSAQPHARPAVGLWPDCRRPRAKGDHRGRRRGGASARHDGLEDARARWIGVPVQTRAAGGRRFPLFHRADAPRHPVADLWASGAAGAANAGETG